MVPTVVGEVARAQLMLPSINRERPDRTAVTFVHEEVIADVQAASVEHDVMVWAQTGLLHE